MPYINSQDRLDLDLGFTSPRSPGELNYLLTQVCLDYLSRNYSYSDLNTVIGALECAKQEFYRRAVVPYEEKKIKENGDIY